MKLFPYLCCELALPRAYMVIFDYLNLSTRLMWSLLHIWQLFALTNHSSISWSGSRQISWLVEIIKGLLQQIHGELA